MPDPLARSTHDDLVGTLFDRIGPARPASTSELADLVSSRHAADRRAAIVQLLHARGPMTLFELADAIGCLDHQISGRVTELKRAGRIEPTGDRRRKPSTGCLCDVYRLIEAPSIDG
jgi:predicted transcriptional regulator